MPTLSDPPVSYVTFDNVTKDRYIEVPVPGHVRQFLLREYGFGAESIKATQNQLLGAIVVSACEKVPYNRVRSRKKQKGSKVKIILPADAEYAHVSLQTLTDLSVIFEKLFFDRMRAFVTCGYYINKSELATVALFLKLYDINPDDWDQDAAYACWKRYKAEFDPEEGNLKRFSPKKQK